MDERLYFVYIAYLLLRQNPDNKLYVDACFVICIIISYIKNLKKQQRRLHKEAEKEKQIKDLENKIKDVEMKLISLNSY
jgi:hypothetical protein